MKALRKPFIALIALILGFGTLALQVEAAEDSIINILHTNDMHGRFIGSGSIMGVDLIAGIANALPNTILVDAGDTFHGIPFATLNQGEDTVVLMNMAGYRVMTPGNHDFNYGQDRLLELAEIADFSIISQNIVRANGQNFLPATTVIEINGFRVGFFGLSHTNTPTLTNPVNVSGLQFTDFIDGARQAVHVLRMDENVDLVVALVHLGSGARSEDRIDGYAIQLAENVGGIDLIIDGHSHTLHEEGVWINDALLVQAGQHGSHVGVVEVDLSSHVLAARVISVAEAQANFEPNAEITALIEEIRAGQQEILSQPITEIGQTLPNDRVRYEETALGNLVADALRAGSNADIALTNGGGIRDVLNAGTVTVGDVIIVLPFGNYGVTMEITPAQLREVLEHSVSNQPNASGGFMQISGFSFVFDPDAEVGSRVVSINIGGTQVSLNDTQTTFIVATNDFLAAGGDGYSVFADLPRVLEFSAMDELFMAHIASADINYETEGRITVGVRGVHEEQEVTNAFEGETIEGLVEFPEIVVVETFNSAEGPQIQPPLSFHEMLWPGDENLRLLPSSSVPEHIVIYMDVRLVADLTDMELNWNPNTGIGVLSGNYGTWGETTLEFNVGSVDVLQNGEETLQMTDRIVDAAEALSLDGRLFVPALFFNDARVNLLVFNSIDDPGTLGISLQSRQ